MQPLVIRAAFKGNAALAYAGSAFRMKPKAFSFDVVAVSFIIDFSINGI